MKNFLNLTLKELENNYDFSFKKFSKKHSLFLIQKNKNKLIFNYVFLNNLTIQKNKQLKNSLKIVAVSLLQKKENLIFLLIN